MLSVLTVNIGAASQERARLLLDWLARRPEEVFVITETSAGPGTSWMLPGFLPFEFGLLEGLRERGLADAYEHVAPGEQAYSWIGRTGDGYRYDYLHVGPGLADFIGACSYLHETRQLRLTDHAAMRLALHAAATPLETSNPIDTEAAADSTLTLF